MGVIEVISASAGTGKTYHLASLLEEEVAAGRVRPDAILATTFTRKAAAELEERVRSRLLEAGRVDDAQRLGASRIGTVNAVCAGLVMDFAFELGLSPSLRVLDEQLAYRALKEALAKVVDRAALDELQELRDRLPDFDWQPVVDRMVDQARNNGLEAGQVRAFAQRSADGFRSLLRPPLDSAEGLERDLLAVVTAFVDWASEHDGKVTTMRVVDKARPLLDRLRSGRGLSWADWYTLARLGRTAKASEALADEVRATAGDVDRHPDLHRDVCRVIELVHEIAASTLESYQDYKRTWGVVDFRDQEVLALDLLGRPEVRERLADELDLVLVDEFQDNSPIQLAIFLRLADLAKRSVWVGDQKQAIFGFRGTDPALLDAVLERLAGDEPPERLTRSWRSRPELVRVTSAIFTRAFEVHDLPPERVAIQPAHEGEPEGLGPIVERWNLLVNARRDEPAALAGNLAKQLEDPEARVRDRDTGVTRSVRPGDVAVLCRTNATCQAVAEALGALGIPAVLPRGGLLTTPEGLVALAGLQLFADPSDALAIATLARFCAHPGDDDAWLDGIVSQPYGRAYGTLQAVAAVRTARDEMPTAGAVAALDRVTEATQLRELCLRWGQSDQRLANLDQLRALAVQYADHCATTGAGCTAAGLAAHFQALAAAKGDRQADLTATDAVHVVTWHAAKGLEWPITVLFELHRGAWDNPLGVTIIDAAERVDLDAPLAQRWLRYWPDPFGAPPWSRPDWGFYQRLAAEPTSIEAHHRAERQALRLLYVGWTRARDRLVLAARPRFLDGRWRGILELLSTPQGRLIGEPGPTAEWCGHTLSVVTRESAGRVAEAALAEPGRGTDPTGPRPHPPATVSPSALKTWGPVGKPIRLGTPLRVRGAPEMSHLGEAFHGFLAADSPSHPESRRRALATRLLESWGVAEAVGTEALLAASVRLFDWLSARWPGATLHREWPLRHRLEDGTVVQGFADLVVVLDRGVTIVDHKTFSGGRKRVLEQAAEHAGQVAAYAHAVERALQRPVASCFIHLPLSALMVELQPAQLTLFPPV